MKRWKWLIVAVAGAAVAYFVWRNRAGARVVIGYLTHPRTGKKLPVVKAAGHVGLAS